MGGANQDWMRFCGFVSEQGVRLYLLQGECALMPEQGRRRRIRAGRRLRATIPVPGASDISSGSGKPGGDSG